ncbi:stalk domain-containing protein [Vallitalea guaymasensis]|uniref:stalk domain-containing protein n=1 Tax=Vallitalea guaymasensis TaxID=1185412 RepID=UPI000DE5375F|nr:stalk domain-containing protein [Vallitalea guaymasensis]
MNKKAIGIMIFIAMMSFTLGANADGIITKISATVDKELNLTLDGERVTPKDAKGNEVPIISYNGSSYLPVRAIASLTGIDVAWDGSTKTIKLIKYPVNLDNPGIMDLNKKGLVKLNYYGDSRCYCTKEVATLTNDPLDLTTLDGDKLEAGIVINSKNSTGHNDILKFDDDRADFNSTTILLNNNYKKMSCYVKVINEGDISTKKYLTAKVGIYDVDNNICIASFDFSKFKLKHEESEFIPLECDVAGIDNVAVICSSELNYVDNKFIIGGIKFKK